MALTQSADSGAGQEATPEISIVVPSHDRALRLRWLLNALEEQTLDRSRWEIVVGHDSSGPETEELLRGHPLFASGNLRYVTQEPGTAPPGANRNAAWRLARAPIIAFTDDDCRPPAEWLENALTAARANPGAIVQGSTTHDPAEENILVALFVHTQSIWPPRPWAQCCNIVYPRAVLEELAGFDESMFVGEDTELALRAAQMGVQYVGEPAVLTYHAVEELSPVSKLLGLQRWGGLAELVKRHPGLRDQFPLWVFWKRTHVWMPLAGLGLRSMLRGRIVRGSVLALPYVMHAMPRHGTSPKARLLSILTFPIAIAADVSEFIGLVRGSIRHRTLLL